MMKYLCTEIPWRKIKAIGFDLDGTLYDEFDFIHQVYFPIAKIFSNSDHDKNTIMKAMLLKWLEKGSSYPFIFSEMAKEVGLENKWQEKKIKEALKIFRNFVPILFLSQRIKFLLEELNCKYELFLVSDGSSTLQWNKIKALGLENYFNNQNVFVSGDYGKGAEKPNLMSMNYLRVFKKGLNSNEIVFIGDRSIDENYAKNGEFYFLNINSLYNRK